MATGKTLSELDTLTALTGAEFLYVIDNGGNSKNVAFNTIVDFIEFEAGIDALLADQNLSDLENVSVARINLGLANMALQDKGAVDIEGGEIENTPIGQVTPDSGRFTTLQVTTSASFPPGSIDVAALTEDSIVVAAGEGIDGGGTVALGGTVNLDVNNIDGGSY